MRTATLCCRGCHNWCSLLQLPVVLESRAVNSKLAGTQSQQPPTLQLMCSSLLQQRAPTNQSSAKTALDTASISDISGVAIRYHTSIITSCNTYRVVHPADWLRLNFTRYLRMLEEGVCRTLACPLLLSRYLCFTCTQRCRQIFKLACPAASQIPGKRVTTG